MSEAIVAYLSHSYRPEDRRVNMEVWKRLNAKGVIFAVDPPDRAKRAMDITFLERMMQQSDCFIAIVPDRSRADNAQGSGQSGPLPSWSPYQELEYRLAVRANKPSLLVVERGIDQGPAADDRALWFERDGPTFSANFDIEVDRLVRLTHATDSSYARKIGILRWNPPHPLWSRLSEAIRANLGDRGEILDADDSSEDHSILARARKTSVVVADLNPRVTPGYVLGLLHGAAVPLFRTCLTEPGIDEKQLGAMLGLAAAVRPAPAGDGLPWPCSLHGYQVDDQMHPVRFWNADSIDRDASEIAHVTEGYAQRDRKLEKKTSAREYFLSLRGNRVFVSTPGDLRELTEKVALALDDAGMPAFHYRVSDMRGGTDWKPQLAAQLRERDLLVGFISPTYWDRDECVEELAIAVERWERHDMQIVLYAPEPLPPLPAFLMRAQVNRIGAADDTMRRVVGELQRRFSEGVQEALEAAAKPLLEPMRRHLSLADKTKLLSELKEICRLPDSEADELADRVVESSNPEEELLGSLISALGADRHGAPALGRLCYWLRSREASPQVRQQLSALFSTLRLFPGLHDVRGWNHRRKRRDVPIKLKADAPKGLLAFAAVDRDKPAAPTEVIRFIGHQVASYLDVADPSTIVNDRDARVYVDGDLAHLSIPLEWALLSGLDEPLSRARPLIRRVPKPAATPRATLEKQFEAGLTGPPRVLLFGDLSALPHVEGELDAIEDILVARYAASSWPKELVRRVPMRGGLAAEATRDALELLLKGSDYEVLHLAGHAGFHGADAVFRLSGEAGADYIRGEDLAGWVRDSMVRFVYLSCCEGAAEALNLDQVTEWRRSLCKELIDAGVAEIVAYVWKVTDAGSVAFTKTFYDVFVTHFDAAAALFEARRTADRSDALWASSVLVQVT